MQFSGLVNAPLRSDLSQVGGPPKKGKKKKNNTKSCGVCTPTSKQGVESQGLNPL